LRIIVRMHMIVMQVYAGAFASRFFNILSSAFSNLFACTVYVLSSPLYCGNWKR
jgi:hypothetical protein